MNKLLPQVTTNPSEGKIFFFALGLPSYMGYDIELGRIPIDGSYYFMIIRRRDVIGINFDKNIKALCSSIYGDEDN